MEKIQIQFKESDFKVYYEYCERYYQIHDVVRKKSIITFLDLFSQGILPIEEQEITQARLLLAQKCGELKKASYDRRNDGDSTVSLQLRSCNDILVFCKDLEKMYRLFQKQGLVANYLVILATFSRVTAAVKNSPISVIYNLDRNMIESLALPLFELIRQRLGIEREWNSVLHELTVLTARFNRVSRGQKFDLDTLKLIAPAVVYHFNQDVEVREILAVLPSYFDECELEEFETLLNRTSEYLQNELDAEIDWEKIAVPLKAISAKVAEQRDQWTRERSHLSDHYTLPAPDEYHSPDGTQSSQVSLSSSFSGVSGAGDQKVFDIHMSPDGSTYVESSLAVFTPVEEEMPKPAIIVHMPIVVGICIILALVFGSVILTGAWNPLEMGNSTANATYTNGTVIKIINTTPAVTTAPATPTPTPKPTTAPPTPVPTPTVYTSSDVSSHLSEIAYGPDNSVIVKPAKDLISVAVLGADRESDVVNVQNFINTFNNYSSTNKLSTNLELNNPADITLTLLPENALRMVKVDKDTIVRKDRISGTYYFIRTGRDPLRGTDGQTYINSDLKGNIRSRWILRALLYDLGFFGETTRTDTLFFSGVNDLGQMTPLDLKALELMYGKKVTNGMARATVKAL
ncbi:MAG: hypothetical protein WC586_02060 [Methanoregula sp.]